MRTLPISFLVSRPIPFLVLLRPFLLTFYTDAILSLAFFRLRPRLIPVVFPSLFFPWLPRKPFLVLLWVCSLQYSLLDQPPPSLFLGPPYPARVPFLRRMDFIDVQVVHIPSLFPRLQTLFLLVKPPVVPLFFGLFSTD